MAPPRCNTPLLPLLLSCLAGLVGAVSMSTVDWSFGVFADAMSSEFPTWSRISITAALSWHSLAAALISPVIGFAVDRVGLEPTILWSLCSMSAGFMTLGFVDEESLALLYVSYVLVGFGYAGACNIGVGKVVGSLYPGRTKGRIMGIVTAFNNIVGLFFVQLTNAMVQMYSWEFAAMAFSGMCVFLAIAFYVSFHFYYDVALAVSKAKNEDEILRDDIDPERHHSVAGVHHRSATSSLLFHGSLGETMRTPTFVFCACGMMCAYYTYLGVLPMIIPALTAEGFTEQEAAHVLSLVAGLGILGKLSCGTFSETITARRAMQLCLLVQSVSLFAFMLVKTDRAGLWVSCALYGLSLGGVAPLLPLVVLELFGNESFGRLYGVILFLFLVPSISGPLVAGQSFDVTKSYDAAFGIAALIFVVGALFLEVAGFFVRRLERVTLEEEVRGLTELQSQPVGYSGFVDSRVEVGEHVKLVDDGVSVPALLKQGRTPTSSPPPSSPRSNAKLALAET